MQTTVPMGSFTRTDHSKEWAIDDNVIQLREWATGKTYLLPAPPTGECTIGAADLCAIRLCDPSCRVSRVHACLLRDENKWLLRDLASKNGVLVDGARRTDIVLEPGMEIGIGGITLIAESALSIALRNFLERLLGWGPERAEVVDHALRSVRMAATRRVALVLCGDGDLVPTARSIHRHSRGADRPFIACDPRRLSNKATVRSAENRASGTEALVAAAGGTICVRSQRLPPDFQYLVEVLRNPGVRIQLMVCASAPEDCELYHVRPIVIPPLATRVAELDRIIREYAADAMAELATVRRDFPTSDHAWVRQHECASLPDIEKATLRIVAIRASKNLSAAAARLGMAPVSLSRWVSRRRLPMVLRE
jgi:pSer/pThr/pTyr-binding forkhead associated (FHA) protein